MTEPLVLIVSALVVIAAAAVVGPRLGVAAPLVLVAVGVGASFLPAFHAVRIEPDWVLDGLLPPLLYASAASMPAMDFRREFRAISGLSVVLVVASALALGLFFMLVLPGLGFAWGVALGAIISPTDAVATSIVKRTPVSQRVVAMLDGESLLNDATALVLLRTAIVATAASFSIWGAIGTFAYSVAVAIVVGWAVGSIDLAVRKRLTDPTVTTVISFAVPFVASVPTELLGASGLVAAVVAGLLTGVSGPRVLSARQRLSDGQNWRTVEFVLEGVVFLVMGVQIRSIVVAVHHDHGGVGTAVLVAAGALVLTVLVRAAYVAPLLRVLRARAGRGASMQQRLEDMQTQLATPGGTGTAIASVGRRRPPGAVATAPSAGRVERFTRRVTQVLADIEYFRRQPLGWREGTAVVWAGMRGAVTVAAAQSLPEDTPMRSVLVLVAFAVAAMSLAVQGGTIGPLLRRIAPERDLAADAAHREEERTRLVTLMRTSSESVPGPHPAEGTPMQEQFTAARDHRLAVIAAQRSALLDARDDGTFDSDVLVGALADLDAAQIAIEMRGTTSRDAG